MVADGFAFAVRIGCEVDVVGLFGGGFELGDELLFAFDDFVMRFEAVLDVDIEVLLGKILDVAKRGFDDEIATEIFVDRFRLGGRFDDYERSFAILKIFRSLSYAARLSASIHKLQARPVSPQFHTLTGFSGPLFCQG